MRELRVKDPDATDAAGRFRTTVWQVIYPLNASSLCPLMAKAEALASQFPRELQ